MLVEYATAVPSELTRGASVFGRRSAPKLAILAVDPGTPAWEAGIRPGHALIGVDGRTVESPDAFSGLVNSRNDTLTLQIVRQNDRPENVSVAGEKSP